MIKRFIIIFTLLLTVSCSPVTIASSPYLVKINKPNDFKDVTYTITNNNTYVFTEENMKELLRQFDWCSNAVDKYEKQIDIVLKYQNKNKKGE